MISLQRVNATAGEFRLVDVDFEIPSGEYGVIVGPAGAGKTTLLETIAGAIRVQSGRVTLGGRDVTRLPPEARDVGIVYQHAYLFPHLSVLENVLYGADSASDGRDLIARFGIEPLSERGVSTLSGGERQLVALARALARRPPVLLLDEPFSALDPRSRDLARRALRGLYDERRFTVLQVTHDFAEAGTLGDVLIVLDKGRIVQQGDPADVFRKPSSPYLASFLGAENVFAGVVEPMSGTPDRGDESRAVSFKTGALSLVAVTDRAAGSAHAILRGEEVVLSREAATSSAQNHFAGRIVEVLHSGPLARVSVDVAGTVVVATVTSRSVHDLGLQRGDAVVASFKATAVHLC